MNFVLKDGLDLHNSWLFANDFNFIVVICCQYKARDYFEGTLKKKVLLTKTFPKSFTKGNLLENQSERSTVITSKYFTC